MYILSGKDRNMSYKTTILVNKTQKYTKMNTSPRPYSEFSPKLWKTLYKHGTYSGLTMPCLAVCFQCQEMKNMNEEKIVIEWLKKNGFTKEDIDMLMADPDAEKDSPQKDTADKA